MAKKYYIGILILVILTASVYVLLQDKIRIDVKETYSTFKVYEDDNWVLAGTERTILWDGAKKMRAASRVVNYTVDGNATKIYRYAFFKEDCLAVDIYSFDGDSIDGFIEKLTTVEKSFDEPSDFVAGYTKYQNVFKYEVAITFIVGVSI